jgi:cell division protein ZapA
MKKINDIEVIINNKRYTLSGYESEEYLQKVASYINNKYNEFKNRDAYKFLDSELRHIMIEINIADDYFKEKENLKSWKTRTTKKATKYLI